MLLAARVQNLLQLVIEKHWLRLTQMHLYLHFQKLMCLQIQKHWLKYLLIDFHSLRDVYLHSWKLPQTRIGSDLQRLTSCLLELLPCLLHFPKLLYLYSQVFDLILLSFRGHHWHKQLFVSQAPPRAPSQPQLSLSGYPVQSV